MTEGGLSPLYTNKLSLTLSLNLQLLALMSGEVPFHLGPAERPFDWIDRSILVAIELLKMVVGQSRIVRVRNARTKMISARIVALGAF